jgi:hypothetical protein
MATALLVAFQPLFEIAVTDLASPAALQCVAVAAAIIRVFVENGDRAYLFEQLETDSALI